MTVISELTSDPGNNMRIEMTVPCQATKPSNHPGILRFLYWANGVALPVHLLDGDGKVSCGQKIVCMAAAEVVSFEETGDRNVLVLHPCDEDVPNAYIQSGSGQFLVSPLSS